LCDWVNFQPAAFSLLQRRWVYMTLGLEMLGLEMLDSFDLTAQTLAFVRVAAKCIHRQSIRGASSN